MQVTIIKNSMAAHTLGKKIQNSQEKKLLLSKKAGIFDNKTHCQVLRD